MVLENSSDSADVYGDSIPASDNDPYSSDPSPPPDTLQYHIDVTHLPTPVPIIGPLLGYNQAYLSKLIDQRLKRNFKVLRRPPTHEEAEAAAFWSAKQMSLSSYGPLVGILGGLWRARSTRDTFRFPFWQPNIEKLMKKFSSNEIPPTLRSFHGPNAVKAIHVARALAYAGIGQFFGQLFFGSYSLSVVTVGEISDPRLKGLREEATRQRAQQSRGKVQNQQRPGTNVPQSQPQPQQEHVNTDRRQNQDDASPTGGMYGDESTRFGNKSGAMETSNDSPRQERRLWPTPEKMSESQDRPFDAFGDASLIGGQDVESETSSRPGSAWERVRMGANTKNPQSPGQSSWPTQRESREERQRGGLGLDNSFSFSKADEDRNSAKPEAQKDFDARVERERRGGDFTDRDGDQRRW